MIGKASKKLIIVCDEKTEVYANYLRQLISTNDDNENEIIGVADGTVEAAVWLEKEYLANKAQISSNEHILFVGDNKVTKSEASSMAVKYDKYGMKYGWLGKRAMMRVDNELLEPEVYDAFFDYALSYQADFEKIAMIKPKTKTIEDKKIIGQIEVNNNEVLVSDDKAIDNKITPKALAQAGTFVSNVGTAAAKGINAAAAIVPVAGASAALGISKGINKIQIHKKVKDQQYRVLSIIMYLDGLQEFLEG